MVFLVVEFQIPPKSTGMAHENWIINETSIYYPPYFKNSEKFKKSVIKGEVPNSVTWKLVTVRILRKCATYEQCRLCLTRSEDTSDLSEKPFGRGRIRKKQRRLSITESDSEDNDKSRRKTSQSSLSSTLAFPEPPRFPDNEEAEKEGLVAELSNGGGEYFTLEEVSSVLARSGSHQPKKEKLVSSAEYNFPAHKDRIGNTLAVLMRKLDIANAKLDQQAEMIQLLLNRGTFGSTVAINAEDFDLPLASVEDLNELELQVNGDKKLKLSLVKVLSSGGGSTCNVTTYRIMGELMTDDIARLYSYAGQTGKLGFRDLALKKCVTSAVKLNPKFSSATDCEIEEAIKYWLKRADSRIKRLTKPKRK